MKFNKAELAVLASQPSTKFDKEGVLFVRERHEGFFKRTEGETGKNYPFLFSLYIDFPFNFVDFCIFCVVMFGYVCSLQGSKAAGPSLMCVGGAGKGEKTDTTLHSTDTDI